MGCGLALKGAYSTYRFSFCSVCLFHFVGMLTLVDSRRSVTWYLHVIGVVVDAVEVRHLLLERVLPEPVHGVVQIRQLLLLALLEGLVFGLQQITRL